MQVRSRHLLFVALLAGVALGMAGCESIRSAAGQEKESPDEFAVVTKAPLVIPPDYNLHPPAAGTAATNALDPTQTAQAALYGTDPAAQLPASMSQGERQLLVNAGVQNADPQIRQEIAADGNAMRSGDDSFASNLLFWSAPQGGASVPLDADSEARRIEAARAAGGSAAPAPAGTPPAPPPSNDDSGSWLDHVWPF